MSQTPGPVGHRPARSTRPQVPPPAEVLAAPPALPDHAQVGGSAQTALPLLGALSSVTMIVVLRHGNPLFLLAGAVLLVVALAGAVLLAVGRRGQGARTRALQRSRYLDHLETVRSRLRGETAEVRRLALVLDPDPAALPQLLSDPARRFERRPADADFLRVRVGMGERPWFAVSVPPAAPLQPPDPLLADQAHALVRRSVRVQGVPVVLDLTAGSVSVVGDRTDVLGVVRAVLAQVVTLHAPTDVGVAVVVPPGRRADWVGADLLPHAVGLADEQAPTGRRRVVSDPAELRGLWSSGPRHWVVLCDDHAGADLGDHAPAGTQELHGQGPDGGSAVTWVHLVAERVHEPADVRRRLELERPGQAPEEGDRPAIGSPVGARLVEVGRPATDDVRVAEVDRLDAAPFEALARAAAPFSVVGPGPAHGGAPTSDPVGDLLAPRAADGSGVDTPPGAVGWLPRTDRDFLRVPIGTDDQGAPVWLDLKESAAAGMGPHGLCVGATGSGKSELLRTLVLGLTATHSPEDLSLVLVDYKGGAAFAPFAGLPHVAGLVDNLADDPQLVQRARTSLTGEVVRRQRLLRDAGSLPSVRSYRRLRRDRPELPALPHLLVVIDEFGELLTAEPDFVDLLVRIGRIGRSIGVHLLLSSQRVESGRLRGLDTHLSYRIGLRTFSAAESTVVLDTPDAFMLPPAPGYGYLKVDTTVYRRFRAGFVSGPAEAAPSATVGRQPVSLLPAYDPPAGSGAAEVTTATGGEPRSGPTLIGACVTRLSRGPTPPVAPVWLPPLPASVSLDRLIAVDLPTDGLCVPLGLLDDPARQTQQPWLLDLARSGGHVALVGAPGTGRSTVLRTLAASLALTHVPSEVSVYGLDLTGGGLRRVEGLPHVGGVAGRGDRERLARTLAEVGRMLDDREAVVASRSIDSPAELRALHRAGRLPELPAADLVLLVDGLDRVRDEFEELADPLADLWQRGSSLGLHVVATMPRWNDLRTALQPLVGTRLELALNDPADSAIDRRRSALLRADQPGRVLTSDGLFAQVALPSLDADAADRPGRLLRAGAGPATSSGTGASTAARLADSGPALERLVAAAAASWRGPHAPPIRTLPASVNYDGLARTGAADELLLGLREDTMEPDLLRLAGVDRHVLVCGDSGAGKTTALQTVLTGVVERHGPEDIVVALLDPREGLDVPTAYLGGRARTGSQAQSLLGSVVEELQRRSEAPDPDVPAVLVVVDDHDLFGSAGRDPLSVLLPFLPSARDVGLHVVLSRPVAGLSRAVYDPSIQGLRDGGATAVLLSGDPGEGQVLGVRPRPSVPGRGRVVRRGERPYVVQVARPPTSTSATAPTHLPRRARPAA